MRALWQKCAAGSPAAARGFRLAYIVENSSFRLFLASLIRHSLSLFRYIVAPLADSPSSSTRRDAFLCPSLVPARLTEAYRDVTPEEWYRHVTVMPVDR